MEKKELKKLLAGLGIASLISMGGISLPGAHAGSGWGADPGTGGTEQHGKKTGCSGWGGSKKDAVSVEDQQQMDKQMKEDQKEEEDNNTKKEKIKEKEIKEVNKPSGGSGWGGSK